MAKIKRWTESQYKQALLGDELPGLRSIVKGFLASDGYDLRHIDQWGSARKRRVRDYYDRVRRLEAQERIIVRPRSQKKLETLINAFHGDIPSKNFKVAFVPYTRPIGLPGAKRGHPKIKYLSEGIAIDAGAYQRLFIPFNKENLVTQTENEINRVLKAMPGARLFFVQTGEFQTLNGMGPRVLTEQIMKYMQLYDGVKQLPRSSGNVGDDPKSHHWRYWLNGIVGFVFPKNLKVNVLQKKIAEGMRQAKERRKKQDAKMKRKRN